MEECVSHSAIRLLTLAACAAALVLAPTLASAKTKAGATRTKSHRLVHRHAGFRSTAFRQPAYYGGPVRQAREVCPGGIARSFECSVWPPPIDDDPDRRISGAASD